MCIVRRKHDEVDWLLNFYRNRGKADLQLFINAKVSGYFFKSERQSEMHDFGETALQFAACTNDTDMFDLVLSYVTSEYPDALFSRDSEGNNLIHLLVSFLFL
jgi:hypothetical protein